MARIAGATTIKNAAGKVTHVKLSVKHHGKYLEDLFLANQMDAARNDEMVPWEDAKKKINKKFGFKN
ncbi:MAG: hypothetical protein H7320_13745 [Ferruginibacter sp.]|nr:hypothetical protein [Ferruginibacter sp.]